mmetsp:Transcript_9560/g.33308  ORF Transcript_9560/g.33308 Transcript_9560/m.33308 type:complete len:672 (+) Transcript_9560:116-2131(+)
MYHLQQAIGTGQGREATESAKKKKGQMWGVIPSYKRSKSSRDDLTDAVSEIRRREEEDTQQVTHSKELSGEFLRIEEEQRKKLQGADDANAPWYYFRPLRRKLWTLFEDPHSSKPAYLLALTVLMLIILSSITFCAETVDAVEENDDIMSIFKVLDWIFLISFTAELVIRWFACPDPARFFADVNNIVDLLAIMPSIIEKIAGDFIDLRFLRLARVFRVFKLSRYGDRMQMVVDALVESKEILMMLTVNLTILIVVFSSIVYFLEDTPEPHDGGHFNSIPAACWWCIVTVLTVGYGDMFPVTVGGKILAGILMVSSLIVLALPITIVGSCFSNQWTAYKEAQRLKELVSELPDEVKKVYPLLFVYKEQFNEHNAQMRGKSKDVNERLRRLGTACQEGNNSTMDSLITTLRKDREDLVTLLDEELSNSNKALKNVLFDLQTAFQDNKQLRLDAQAALETLETEVRDAMVQSFSNKHKFLTGRDMGDYTGVLIVYLKGASGLTAKDITGASDPYVVAKQGREEQKSKVVYNSLSPLFDEHLVLFVSSLYEPLTLQVMDKDTVGRDEPMGKVEVKNTRDLLSGEQIDFTEEVQGGKGQLKFSLRYVPSEDIDISTLKDKQVWESVCSQLLGTQVMPGPAKNLPQSHAVEMVHPAAAGGTGQGAPETPGTVPSEE